MPPFVASMGRFRGLSRQKNRLFILAFKSNSLKNTIGKCIIQVLSLIKKYAHVNLVATFFRRRLVDVGPVLRSQFFRERLSANLLLRYFPLGFSSFVLVFNLFIVAIL